MNRIPLAVIAFLNLLVHSANGEVDFVKQIQPILRERCYECHGPETREAGLRLDQRDSALAGGDSGQVISPGEPDESLLIKLVAGDDPDRVMPPDGENLSAEQVSIIREWVAAGAPWPDDVDPEVERSTHWSFQPIQKPSAPEVLHSKFVASDIDRFVISRLEGKGLVPSPEADRNTLIKRLYYDLLGLTPTPEAVDRFIQDDHPDAYERLVDELLESPHFGERWGRHWLDKARYADSDGYEKDRPRYHAWKYRDWVIHAINEDLPFDQFTVEQLAGDLLPDPTDNQLLATAFNRQTLTNTEGGTDQEEFRVAAIFDRIETIGTVWLGLTVGCARCHSHKYDDISQREYYELFAFFNNADETNVQMASSQEAMAEYQTLKRDFDQKLKELSKPLMEAKEAVRPGFSAWEQDQQRLLAQLAEGTKDVLVPEQARVFATSGATLERQDDGSYLASGREAGKDIYEIDIAATDLKAPLEQPWTGIKLEMVTDDSLNSNGPGRSANGNFVLSEITLDRTVPSGESKRQSFRKATADHSQNGFDVSQAIDGDEQQKGWAIAPQMGKPHTATFLFAEPIDAFEENERIRIRLVQNYESPHLLGRFRVSLINGHSSESLALPENIQKILALTPGKRNPKQQNELFDFYSHLDDKVRELQAKVDQFEKKTPFHPIMDVAVLKERTTSPRVTKVMKRGDFLQPLGEVSPDTFDLLPPITARNGGVPDRLDLAKWLVSEENPLSPRIFVNNVWGRLFGQGLVGTVNDFGVRGELPTHPELLDWLAVNLMENAWSRKSLIKTIVLSRTYRQSSRHRPELQEIDPQNKFFARQNRYRVEAEVIRDLYLAASGMLESRIGGPSVFPEIPPGIAELSYANNFKWGSSDWNSRPDRPHGVSPKDDIYRRGMYTFFKRTAPHPNLMTFDCPDANVSCVERTSSNTPLQALQTLNNDVFVTASKKLAEQLESDESLVNDEERLEELFLRCLARRPTSDERGALLQLQTDAAAFYREQPVAARELTGMEETTPIDQLSRSAAIVTISRVVMNLDEFITRE
ncbi:MAG: PSD1 domain-containing protein [Planctomycetaceae bacterium]|nr:PSD1 domain-containing protein [Planctomycetaceae bacterium]